MTNDKWQLTNTQCQWQITIWNDKEQMTIPQETQESAIEDNRRQIKHKETQIKYK